MPPTYDATFPALAHVLLEESWVLAVRLSPGEVRFEIEAVLTPGHPAYGPPAPGEVHAYLPATLVLRSAAPAFGAGDLRGALDATGERDLGHLDVMVLVRADPPTWRLEGDWGSLEVVDPVVTLVER